MTRRATQHDTARSHYAEIVNRKETMTRETRRGLLAFTAVVTLAIALATDLHRIAIAAIYPHMFEIYKFLFWN